MSEEATVFWLLILAIMLGAVSVGTGTAGGVAVLALDLLFIGLFAADAVACWRSVRRGFFLAIFLGATFVVIRLSASLSVGSTMEGAFQTDAAVTIPGLLTIFYGFRAYRDRAAQ